LNEYDEEYRKKKTISLVTFQEHKDEHNTVNNRNPKKSMIFFFHKRSKIPYAKKKKDLQDTS
jgi:hypothetical protein